MLPSSTCDIIIAPNGFIFVSNHVCWASAIASADIADLLAPLPLEQVGKLQDVQEYNIQQRCVIEGLTHFYILNIILRKVITMLFHLSILWNINTISTQYYNWYNNITLHYAQKSIQVVLFLCYFLWDCILRYHIKFNKASNQQNSTKLQLLSRIEMFAKLPFRKRSVK